MEGSLPRWREIDALFSAALELAPEERAAFLAEACGDDTELRREVEALLRAAESADRFLESADQRFGALWRELAEELPATEPPASERIGPYRVVRELSRGGMGTVYLAERADEQFRQRVAIKVLRRGLDTDDLLARFLAERQILATLNHPNIARLLDGGADEDGRPYLVMEYVEGRPMDEYCDERRLTIPERLRLFCVAGRAVQYAHRHLVVHRDLKPSNILVTEEGAVKLLDFGIAKLLDEAAVPEAAVRTRTGVQLMTPGYASPEQVRGEPVTTASDVYQLGLLLYELLAGRRPYGLTGLSQTELERAICEEMPTPPSQALARDDGAAGAEGDGDRETPAARARARRADVPGLRRRLRGDLDTIVMTALRKEPDRRYGSVDGLIEDIERHLKGQPVTARRDSLGYRARKFVGRHRFGVAAAAGFVLLLAAYGATITVQADRIAAERDRAEAVKNFLVEVFTVADPKVGLGDTITARTLLTRGAERVEAELADRPALRAEMMEVIGEVHTNLGLYDRAIPLLERAVELGREVYGPDDERLADVLAALGYAHRAHRRFDAAVPYLREALQIQRARFGRDDRQVGHTLLDLGYALRDIGEPDSAERLFREALQVFSTDPGPESAEYLNALHGLAYALRAQDRLEEAESVYREVLEKQRRLDVPDHEVAPTLNNLAYLLRVKEDYQAAEPLYREALRILEGVYGRGHPTTLMVARNLASSLHEQGKNAETIRILERNVAAARERWPQGSWQVGLEHRSLGVALLKFGRHADCERTLSEALRMYRESVGAENVGTAATRVLLGACLALQGRRVEAGHLFDRSLADLRSVVEARELEGWEHGEISFLVQFLEEKGLHTQAQRFRTLTA